MSTTIRACAVLGQRIAVEAIYTTAKNIGCKHTVAKAPFDFESGEADNPLNAIFCLKCGRKIKIEPASEKFDVNDLPGSVEAKGIKVVHGMQEWIYIGFVAEQDPEEPLDHKQRLIASTQNITEARQLVKTFLEPFKLWDESQFGIWAVQYVG